MNYLSFSAAVFLPVAMISCSSVSDDYEPAQSALLLLAQDSTLAAMQDMKVGSDDTQVSLTKKYIVKGISRVERLDPSAHCQDFLKALTQLDDHSDDGGLAFEEKFPILNAITMMGLHQAVAGLQAIQGKASSKAAIQRARRVFAIQEAWLQDAQMQDFLRAMAKADLRYSPLVWNMTWLSDPPPAKLLEAELAKKASDNAAYYADLRSAASRLPVSMRSHVDFVLPLLESAKGISSFKQLSDEQLAAFFFIQTTPMIARIPVVYAEEMD